MALPQYLMTPGRPASDSWIEDDLPTNQALGQVYFDGTGRKLRLCKMANTARLTGTAFIAGDAVMWADGDEYEVTDQRASAINPAASANIYIAAGVCEGAFTGGASDSSTVAVCILLVIDGPATCNTIGGANIVDGALVMHGLNDLAQVANYGSYPGARSEYDWMNLIYGIVGHATADEAASAVTVWVKPSAY